MPAKQVTLELASFLDSDQARILEGPTQDQVKRIAQIFLEVCYDGIGKAPHLLDGQDMHAAIGHLMPERFGLRDPVAEHVPLVMRAFLHHLETTRTVTQAFEIRRGLEETLLEFLETVRTGRNAHMHGHHASPQKPFVHNADKTGRNDPCFCGSGKKFKKCHGKGA